MNRIYPANPVNPVILWKTSIADRAFFLYIYTCAKQCWHNTKRANHSQFVEEGLGPSNAANQLEEHRAHGRNFCRERYFAFVSRSRHR